MCVGFRYKIEVSYRRDRDNVVCVVTNIRLEGKLCDVA